MVGKRKSRVSGERGDGDVVGEYPLRLAFSSERGGSDVVGEYPLRLAFRAREGGGDMVGKRALWAPVLRFELKGGGSVVKVASASRSSEGG